LAIGFAARRLMVGTIGWAFVVTGLLGGFTTFSALAVQLNALVEAERSELALAYGAVTLSAGVGATLIARRGQPTQTTP
jgi:CrcB protein